MKLINKLIKYITIFKIITANTPLRKKLTYITMLYITLKHIKTNKNITDNK